MEHKAFDLTDNENYTTITYIEEGANNVSIEAAFMRANDKVQELAQKDNLKTMQIIINGQIYCDLTENLVDNN